MAGPSSRFPLDILTPRRPPRPPTIPHPRRSAAVEPSRSFAMHTVGNDRWGSSRARADRRARTPDTVPTSWGVGLHAERGFERGHGPGEVRGAAIAGGELIGAAGVGVIESGGADLVEREDDVLRLGGDVERLGHRGGV